VYHWLGSPTLGCHGDRLHDRSRALIASGLSCYRKALHRHRTRPIAPSRLPLCRLALPQMRRVADATAPPRFRIRRAHQNSPPRSHPAIRRHPRFARVYRSPAYSRIQRFLLSLPCKLMGEIQSQPVESLERRSSSVTRGCPRLRWSSATTGRIASLRLNNHPQLGGKGCSAAAKGYGHADVEVLNGLALFQDFRRPNVWIRTARRQGTPSAFLLRAPHAAMPPSRSGEGSFAPFILKSTTPRRQDLRGFVSESAAPTADWTRRAHRRNGGGDQEDRAPEGHASVVFSAALFRRRGCVAQSIGSRYLRIVTRGPRKDEFAKLQKNLREKLGSTDRRRCSRSLLRKAGRHHRSRVEAQDHRREFIAVFDDESQN